MQMNINKFTMYSKLLVTRDTHYIEFDDWEAVAEPVVPVSITAATSWDFSYVHAIYRQRLLHSNLHFTGDILALQPKCNGW